MGATVPSAPTSLVFTAAAKTPSLTITWDPTADNGAALYDYEIAIVAASGGTPTVLSCDGTQAAPWAQLAAPTFTIDVAQFGAMVAAVQYQVRVRGVSSMGNGAWSAYTATTDNRGFTLGQMTQVANFGRHSDVAVGTAIKLSWDDDTNWMGQTVLTQVIYKIYGSQEDGLQTELLHSLNGVEWDHTDLTPEDTWYYTIVVNNGGFFDSPVTDVMEMKVAPAPNKVPSVTLASSTITQIVVSWTAPTYNGDRILKYIIRRTGVADIDVENTAASYTLTDLPNGDIVVRIVAVNPVQESAELQCTVEVCPGGITVCSAAPYLSTCT